MAIPLFLKALWKRWWALMSCAVFTGIGVFAAAMNKSNSWIVGVSALAAIVLLVVASFLAWNEEHNARVAAETRLNDERPRVLFGLLCPAVDWTNKDDVASVGEYVFTLTNCGKRAATYVHIEPVKSVAGKFTLHFEDVSVLRPDGHYFSISHEINDGVQRRRLVKNMLWEFLHNLPIEKQKENFEIVVRFRDMQEERQIVAKMEFDLNTKQLTVLPH